VDEVDEVDEVDKVDEVDAGGDVKEAAVATTGPAIVRAAAGSWL
jgi:hypothetical protein